MERQIAIQSLGGQLPDDNPKEKFIILYSGAVNRYYNFQFLITLAETFKGTDDVQFLIAGEGEEKENLIKICKARGLSNVYFCPYLMDRDLIPLRINLADLCIIPLRENNNPSAIFDPYVLELPTKLFEYTSCGRPVLCIGQGETADILTKWNAGIGVKSDTENVAKIICELTTDKAKTKAMGDKARKLAEVVFSLECVGEKIDDIIKRVMFGEKSN